MKRYWIEYSEEFSRSPMTFWVHKEIGDGPWYQAIDFDPPLPKPVPGKGFANYFVECDGFTFQFSSLDEMNEAIEVLSKKNLPTSRQLSERRGTTKGPNSHWLSRLPGSVKPWRYREKAVKVLSDAIVEFRKQAQCA